MSVIKKQSLQGLILTYFGVAVGFISQGFLIPALLSKAQNGLLGVLQAYLYVIVQFANLGFNAAGGRFFPYFNNPEKKHRGFLFTGIAISMVGFMVCMLLLFVFKPFNWHIGYKPTNIGDHTLLQQYYYLLFPISLGVLIFNIFDNYARNLKDTVTGTFLSQFVTRFISFIGLLLLAYGFISADFFIYWWCLAFIIPTFFMIAKAMRLGHFSLRPDFSIFTPDFKKSFIHYSFINVITGLSSMVIIYIDKIMLERLNIDLSLIGVYNTASLFATVMGMSLIAMNKTSIPVLSNAFKNEDFDAIATIYRKSCLMQLILGCLLFGCILINLDTYFVVIGNGYEAGKWIIIILCLGKLYDLATGLNGTLLSLSKFYRYDSYTMYSLIVVVVIANLIFIPKFGILGAAFGAVFATIYYNTARLWLVWKRLGMQPFDQRNVKVLGLSAVFTAIAYYLPHISGNLLYAAIDVAYRSAVLAIPYIFLVYKSNVSTEMNQLIDKGMGLVKRII